MSLVSSAGSRFILPPASAEEAPQAGEGPRGEANSTFTQSCISHALYLKVRIRGNVCDCAGVSPFPLLTGRRLKITPLNAAAAWKRSEESPLGPKWATKSRELSEATFVEQTGLSLVL